MTTFNFFSDDIIRAVKKLKSLGHGFEIITSPDGHNFIQSVPGEMVCIYNIP